MCELHFFRKFNEKYKTSKIFVIASLKLEGCERLQKEKTDYGYQKAVVKLSPEKVTAIKEIEEKVNKYLQKERLSYKALVYGNIVYPKIVVDNQKTINLKVCGSTLKRNLIHSYG